MSGGSSVNHRVSGNPYKHRICATPFKLRIRANCNHRVWAHLYKHSVGANPVNIGYVQTPMNIGCVQTPTNVGCVQTYEHANWTFTLCSDLHSIYNSMRIRNRTNQCFIFLGVWCVVFESQREVWVFCLDVYQISSVFCVYDLGVVSCGICFVFRALCSVSLKLVNNLEIKFMM